MNANIEEEIEKYLKDIDDLGFSKTLSLNTKQLSSLAGVSSSTIEKWRKEALGPEFSIVSGRIFYLKRKIAEWLVLSNVKTG